MIYVNTKYLGIRGASIFYPELKMSQKMTAELGAAKTLLICFNDILDRHTHWKKQEDKVDELSKAFDTSSEMFDILVDEHKECFGSLTEFLVHYFSVRVLNPDDRNYLFNCKDYRDEKRELVFNLFSNINLKRVQSKQMTVEKTAEIKSALDMLLIILSGVQARFTEKEKENLRELKEKIKQFENLRSFSGLLVYWNDITKVLLEIMKTFGYDEKHWTFDWEQDSLEDNLKIYNRETIPKEKIQESGEGIALLPYWSGREERIIRALELLEVYNKLNIVLQEVNSSSYGASLLEEFPEKLLDKSKSILQDALLRMTVYMREYVMSDYVKKSIYDYKEVISENVSELDKEFEEQMKNEKDVNQLLYMMKRTSLISKGIVSDIYKYGDVEKYATFKDMLEYWCPLWNLSFKEIEENEDSILEKSQNGEIFLPFISSFEDNRQKLLKMKKDFGKLMAIFGDRGEVWDFSSDVYNI